MNRIKPILELSDPKELKAIIFDMDGVLVETEGYHYEAWKYTLASAGIDLTLGSYERYCQAQGREQALAHFLPNATSSTLHELAQKKGEHFRFLLNTKGLRLFEDAKDLLLRIKEGSLKAVIASSSRQAEEVIAGTGYRDYFDFVLGGNEAGRNKPFPDLFLLAQERLGLSKNQIVVIEDSLSGILASRLAGIDVYALDRNLSFIDLEAKLCNLLQEKKALLTDEELKAFHQSKTFVIQSLDEI